MPGARLPDAKAALRDAELAATTILGRGDAGDAALYAYLGWVLDMTRVLRSKFVAADVDALLLARRYWHLQPTGQVDLQMAQQLDPDLRTSRT